MASRSMQLVTYVSLLIELVASCAQANFLPAKDGDGCFDLLGIQVGNKQYPVPAPGQPNFLVNLAKSYDVSHPCCAMIGVIARDGDFFGDPIPDVWEQTLYYRWEVDGEVPENYFSNCVSCFQYCRGNGLLNKAKYWTYGDHTLTCYVRDPRPGEQGYLYADDWPTVWRGGMGWDKKLDITVRILEPYCSLEFVKPTPEKTLAGNSLVLFKVKTRCTTLKSLSLKLCEKTDIHSPQNVELLYEWNPVATEYDENTCITTTTYRAMFNTTDFHNGSHTLTLAAQYTYVKEQENGEDDLVIVEEVRETSASVNVNIKNLAITTLEPEGVLAWKGEGNPSIPITVNMVDDDFNDPVNVYVYIYPTNADNRQGWGSPIATRQVLGVTSSSVQISWDGRIGNTPGEGEYAEPWTYTYDVKVYQEDINEEDFEPNDPNRVCGVGDRYRSEYLTIYRDVDEQGQPIYDAEYYGYDEGDPEDPNDDFDEYYIRYYKLADFRYPKVSEDASEGILWLYDPDLNIVGTWDIGQLQCLTHESCDGLCATADGVQHALLVRVPAGVISEEGIYRFVIHIRDGHAADYRDHGNRWALDLNGGQRIRVFHIEDDWMVRPNGIELVPGARSPRIKNALKAGNWILRTAGDVGVDSSFCGALPSWAYSNSLLESEFDSYSKQWFHYYDSRNGGIFGHPDPYRYVHVVGIDRKQGDHSSDGCEYGLCDMGKRWCYVYVGHMRDCIGGAFFDEARIMVTLHEIGHQLGLPDHTEDIRKIKTVHDKACIMMQGEPSSLVDLWFCPNCLKRMRNYSGYGW